MINNNELIDQIKSYNKFLNSESLNKAITVAPASANAIEHALPNPLPAPVTKAYLFFRFIF